MKQLIGVGLIGLPFGAVFGAMAYGVGLTAAVAVFGIAAVVIGCLAAGMYLVVG